MFRFCLWEINYRVYPWVAILAETGHASMHGTVGLYLAWQDDSEASSQGIIKALSNQVFVCASSLHRVRLWTCNWTGWLWEICKGGFLAVTTHRNVIIYTQHGTQRKKRAYTNIQIQHANAYIYVQPVQKKKTHFQAVSSQTRVHHTPISRTVEYLWVLLNT